MPAADNLTALLAAARRVTGLQVILRDLADRAGLERDVRLHLGPACRTAMATEAGRSACLGFCAGSVLRDLATAAAGRIHRCPHGRTEIAVPVHHQERFLAVLYAGPEADAPDPDRAWLEDRLVLLEALALRLAPLLAEAPPTGDDRPARITAWIEAGLAGDLPLAGLAAHLGLSESRCGHLVRDHFGCTWPALVRRLRLEAAARLLARGEGPVAAVAARVGCQDQDWFTRHFRARYGCTPSAWGGRHRSA